MKDSDLTRYKNSISNIPTYSKEEEKVIFEKFNKNKNDINLRNEIIKHNLKLVTSVVYKYSNNKNSISDLISYGNEGLIYAVDHFDPTLNIAFSTYAISCITGKILLYINKLNYPLSTSRKFIKCMEEFEKYIYLYYSIHNKYPSDEEIIEKLKIKKEILNILKWYPRSMINLNAPEKDDTTTTFEEVIPDENCNIELEVEDKIHESEMLKIIDKILTKKEKRIFLKYIEDNNFTSISKKTGVSRQRVYQVVTNSKKKILANKDFKKLLK